MQLHFVVQNHCFLLKKVKPALFELQLTESNKNVNTLPYKGNIGGRCGISRLFHGVSPRAVVFVTSEFH